MTDLDAREMGKLRWRCRRGMRELDELLTRYVDEEFHSASRTEQAAFRRLLESADPVIYAYCLRHERPPSPEMAALIDRLTSRASRDLRF